MAVVLVVLTVEGAVVLTVEGAVAPTVELVDVVAPMAPLKAIDEMSIAAAPMIVLLLFVFIFRFLSFSFFCLCDILQALNIKTKET